MKATLTFDLKEDKHTFDCTMNAVNMHSAIMELREYLRTLELKQTLTDDQYKIIGQLRAWFADELEDQGLSQLF